MDSRIAAVPQPPQPPPPSPAHRSARNLGGGGGGARTRAVRTNHTNIRPSAPPCEAGPSGKTRLPQVETTNLKNTYQNCSPGGGSTVNGKNKKTADRILDLIQNEIDLQGKCIEDLSKEIRFHLEQKREESRSDAMLDELRSLKAEMRAHRTELAELRHDFSRLMSQK